MIMGAENIKINRSTVASTQEIYILVGEDNTSTSKYNNWIVTELCCSIHGKQRREPSNLREVEDLRKRLIKEGNTETAQARRTTILQPVEQKPHSQKDGQDVKAEGYVRDEGTRWNPIKTTKWRGDRQPSRKRIQNNDSEDDAGPRKKNGGKDREDARNV